MRTIQQQLIMINSTNTPGQVISILDSNVNAARSRIAIHPSVTGLTSRWDGKFPDAAYNIIL